MDLVEPTLGQLKENKKRQPHTLCLLSLKHLNIAEQSRLSFIYYTLPIKIIYNSVRKLRVNRL